VTAVASLSVPVFDAVSMTAKTPSQWAGYGNRRLLPVDGDLDRIEHETIDDSDHKMVVYKRSSRNHLLDQVESFRIGDKQSDCEEDLLDTFCYGIALALGNSEGF
jgi:hypothetical protein